MTKEIKPGMRDKMVYHTWQEVMRYLLNRGQIEKAYTFACAIRGPDVCPKLITSQLLLERRSIVKSMLTGLIRGGDSYSTDYLYKPNAELREALEGMDPHFLYHISGGFVSLSFYYREARGNEVISSILYYLAEALSEKKFYNAVYYCRKLNARVGILGSDNSGGFNE